ncbi:MAG: TIGR00730 family Rossman fold protein [Polyangiaceae bacterium]|nr:TIGR00730 family Rossman fold protein [Polyangiaceae bacterium]
MTAEPVGVCVFCGSAASPRYLSLARELGAALARRGARLVYGGATVGLMGAVAAGALEAGGEAWGVLPEGLRAREVGHLGLTRLEIVPDMATRKARMDELSRAFVVLPGGFGTLDEWFEMLTWQLLGLHDKPSVALDPDGYYDGLFAWAERAAADGLLAARPHATLRRATSIDAALDAVLG